jgi:pimeloyl-ACP methyl ester carboxylesterase
MLEYINMRHFIFYFLSFSLIAALTFGWYRTTQIKADVETRLPAHGQLIDIPSGRVHLVDIGLSDAPSNKTIVLLHGATSNLRDVHSSLGVPLSSDYRVISIDRPGHGWSSRNGVADAQLDAQATFVVEALAAIGVKQAVIIGHSWAGALVMKLALDYPQLTHSLVLLSPVTHPWPDGIAWYHHVVTTPILGDVFINAIAAPIGRSTLPSAIKSVFSPSIPPDDYVNKIGVELVFRPAEFLANSQDMKDLLTQVTAQSPRYRGMDVPALIMTGDTDSVVSPTVHSRTVAKELKNSKLVILDGAGHAPHHSRTDEVLREIRAFVR